MKQLTEFKAGKRQNPIMTGIASTLSDADMKNVAAFYAGKQAKPGFAKSKDLASAGEKIYRGGVAGPAVPACAGCHGPSGRHSRPVSAPVRAACRLRGGPAAHVQERCAPQQRGDDQIAAKLGDHDIKALADYVAGLR